MSIAYRVKAFAARAGVTVKTLHHYDRLDLLKPRRTPSGYRAYSDADLERLEQIGALKVIGVPLKEIAQLLKGESRPLGEILESQRRVLHARRRVIDRAIDAIERAQRSRADGVDDEADVLRTLIEAIEMQNNVDVLEVYFDAAAWQEWRASHDEWPGPEWRTLLEEIEASLHIDPASERAGTLAERWNDLAKADAGGIRGARTAFLKAWREWLVRPDTRPPQFAAFDMDRILPFIVTAADAELERRRLASPETARVPPRVSASRLALFRDVAQALGTEPSSDVGKRLAQRYDAVLDAETGGDAALKAEMRHDWAYRSSWPAGALRWVASLYDMDPKTWVAASDYLRLAVEFHA